VNLAGEPLMGGRWTAACRAAIEGSRIAVTEQLVRAMAEAKNHPRERRTDGGSRAEDPERFSD